MRWLLSIAVLLMGFMVSSPSHGQLFCADRTTIVNHLAVEYGEELIKVKKVEIGLLEVLGSPTTGSWTLLLTHSDKTSCILATGRGLDTTEDLLEPMEYLL